MIALYEHAVHCSSHCLHQYATIKVPRSDNDYSLERAHTSPF